MSKAREADIIQSFKYIKGEKVFVSFIELTPEVQRKLELFDEAVEVIRKYKQQVHVTGYGISPEESWAAKTFLKKIGEYDE